MNPAPVITSLSPNSANVGAANVAMTVTGSNFAQGSVVRWNGQDRSTTFVSVTQLTAAIPAADLVAAGTAQVTVFTPEPGGGTSAALPFMILNLTPGNITTVSPTSAAAGAAGFMLTVNGANFSSLSVVRFNGSDRATTFVNSTQLLATILASDLAAGGTNSITVFTPAPGGGVTSALNFIVNFPVPVVTSLSPTSATAGGAAFTLTVNGSGFFLASAVNWNGSSRVTTFVNNTQLTTMVAAADISAAGTAQVTVTNPAPGGGTSNAQTFTINPMVAPAGVVERISVASDGTQGNRGVGFGSAVTSDGRFVAFNSDASNLVTGDTNGFIDFFVRDTCLGATGCTPSTIRVSVDSNGAQSNGPSFDHSISISDDGRFVVFVSSATNLVASDTNGFSDIFVRDICAGATGCTPSTIRASVASGGSEATGGDSSTASITPDGRFVVFGSAADNLVAGDTNNNFDVFVRDTCTGTTGCTPTTMRVSLTSGGGEINFGSGIPAISGDRRFVAFVSLSDLVAGDMNGIQDVYVRDTCFGAPMGCGPSTTLVSVASDGTAAGTLFAFPDISADGRFVAFVSTAGTIVSGDTNNAIDDFVRDTCAGATGCTPSTVRVSLGFDGSEAASGTEGVLSMSADARFVAFSSISMNLVSGDRNSIVDVFVRDTCLGATGCTPTTMRASVRASDGFPANQNCSFPALAANGRFVTFFSTSNVLVSGDTNNVDDFFLARTGF